MHEPLTDATTKAVLFDLDGTFADTAPDMSHALNAMRKARGLDAVPLEATRPVTSLGARGLLGVGFGLKPGDEAYDAMRAEFLDLYSEDLCRESCLFSGTEDLLQALEHRGIRWGIVTNKPERFARPLLQLLGVAQRAACIIGGDTAPRAKPFPDPLFAACSLLSVKPADCIYVGDDHRDVDAAHAAGMRAVVVRYGYLNGGDPERWGAEAIIDRPIDLMSRL
jgi:N-acetyl-D-muramate 6-phosphate phosphatase